MTFRTFSMKTELFIQSSLLCVGEWGGVGGGEVAWKLICIYSACTNIFFISFNATDHRWISYLCAVKSIQLIEVTKCLVAFKIQPSYIIQEEGVTKSRLKMLFYTEQFDSWTGIVSNIKVFYVHMHSIEISHFSSGIVVWGSSQKKEGRNVHAYS